MKDSAELLNSTSQLLGGRINTSDENEDFEP